jgi:outer membrane receptor protein involved in Fe transport
MTTRKTMSRATTSALLGSSILALLAAAPTAVYAQETSSAIHGTVVLNGAPAVGKAVTILHVPSGTRQTTTTNSEGLFDARGLRVGGPYTITVGDKAYPNVFIELGKTYAFDADMTTSTELAAVQVVATARRTADQGPVTLLNRDAIQAVVSVNRDIRDLAGRDILVNADLSGGRSGTNSGGISIAGSNPRFNRITVDGVSAGDNFGLSQGGLTTARGPVTLDAIEQFVVAAVPTDVENGDFTGGALNLVLRSGTNSFHGTVFDNYLNDGMVGRHLGDTRIVTPISQTNYGGFLSGPILKNKLFFAVSYENYKTFDTTLFGPIGQGFPNSNTNLTQSTVDQVTGIYTNGYKSKFDLGTDAKTEPVLDKKYSAKIDWNITDRHRATFTYRYALSSSVSRTDQGLTTDSLSSHWYTQSNRDKAGTLELHSNWTDDFTTTFKTTYRDYLNGQNPPSGQNYSDVAVCTAPTSDATLTSCQSGFSQVRFGPDQFRHANALAEKELRFNLQGEYTYGDNLVKIGGQARRATPSDLFVPQSRGVYYFDSIADFAAGKANSLNYNNSVTGNPLDAGFNTTYWTYSVFAQDTFQFMDNLKMTFGARYDWYSYKDKPLLNPNFLARNGFTNQGTIDKLNIVQPRLSIEWKATPDLRVNGGFGLFAGGTPDVLTGTPFYNTGYATTSVLLNRTATGFVDINNTPGFSQAIGSTGLDNLNNDPNFGYQIPGSVKALQQGTLAGAPLIPPLGEVFALDPKFKLPASWKEFLSVHYRFMGFNIGLDAVAAQARNQITYYDSRAKLLVVNGVQQFLPDGRIRYDGIAGSANNLGANRDIIISNKSKGSTYDVGLTVSKNWAWGGEFSVGYAHARSSDLGPGLRFGTTAGSLYASVPAYADPNRDFNGRSVDEIKNQFKFELGYRHDFIKDNETRITLFGSRQNGRPYGFFMSDLTTGRGPVFGVNRTAQALYVPDFSQTSGLDVGLVHFATQADFDLFKAYVARFHLKPGLNTKYTNTNRNINRLDLQFSQQLPSPIQGHHFRLVLDLRNALNFLNSHWGAVQEYNDVNTLTRVNCADAVGNAAASGNAACPRYRYSNVPTSITPTVNNALSLWYLQVGLRYEF